MAIGFKRKIIFTIIALSIIFFSFYFFQAIQSAIAQAASNSQPDIQVQPEVGGMKEIDIKQAHFPSDFDLMMRWLAKGANFYFYASIDSLKDIWNSRLKIYFDSAWQKSTSFLNTQVEQRAPTVKQGLDREVAKMKIDAPQTFKFLWQKAKDFYNYIKW